MIYNIHVHKQQMVRHLKGCGRLNHRLLSKLMKQYFTHVRMTIIATPNKKNDLTHYNVLVLHVHVLP